MDIVLDVAFVIAVVAFIKEQFGVTGKTVLLWAFLVCVVIGVAPLIASAFPIAAPYISVVLKIVVLFLAAAGSWDGARQLTVKQVRKVSTPP